MIKYRLLLSFCLMGMLTAMILFSFGSCKNDDEFIPMEEEEMVEMEEEIVEEEEEEEMEELPSLTLPSLPNIPFDYERNPLPEEFLASSFTFFENTPQANPTTNEGATLGRVLFFDKLLSLDSTVSCGTCHLPEKAFTDGLVFSQGIQGQHTNRNSMTLANHRYGFRLFWDARSSNLEDQVLLPIQDPIEMGMDLAELENRLNDNVYYPSLFYAAFGDSTVTSDNLAKGLSQFIRSIYSYESKYDKGIQNDFSDFSERELHGKDLFFSNELLCATCHAPPTFNTTGTPLNNGLVLSPQDIGYGDVTNNSQDDGKFKTPTLRNIGLTAPYMHDGRFETLFEVVEHYNSNLQAHPNLDDRLTTNGEIGGPPKQFNLSKEEKTALVAFLNTLTDETYVKEERYQDPF